MSNNRGTQQMTNKISDNKGSNKMGENRGIQQNIQTTIIPLNLSINYNLGILKFLSEKSSQKLEGAQIQLKKIQQDITYKSNIGKWQDQSDEDEQMDKKKIVNYNRIIIKSQKWDKKYYKSYIPINKYLGSNARNKDRAHFVLKFGNQKYGQLTMIDDLYDCQLDVQLANDHKIMTFDQKIKIQNSKLDARRRQERVQILTEKKDNKKKQK